MTKTLKLSPELSPPIDALMQPIALMGNRGAGKSYAGMKLFELAHDAEVQCIAIDGIGKWWGLRLAADGRAPGLKDVYIFGGKRADFSITPDRGAFVAKVLVERRIHAVLDVSQWRKADRRRFLTDFAEEFHLLKKQEDQPTPSVLFLEEAHQVLPQKPFGEEARMLGAFEDLIREGRNAGIGMVVMDQRPATCNKNALALVEILIALRTTYEIDRKVYVGWVVQKVAQEGLEVDLEKRLPFLKAGQGFFYAPMFDLFGEIQIYPKRTFDSSATAKIGVKAAAIGTLTPVDVERVKDAMATVTAEVASKDPTALRKRVAELEKQLAAKAPPPAPKVERVEVRAISADELKRVEKVLHGSQDLATKLLGGIGDLSNLLTDIRLKLRGFTEPGPMRPPAHRAPAPLPVRAAAPREGGVDVQELKLIGKSKDMLQALAAFPGGLSKRSLGVWIAMASSGGGFNNYLGALRSAGYVEGSDPLRITSAGRVALEAVSPGPLPDPAEVIERWVEKLPGKGKQIFRALMEARPNPCHRDDLAKLVEMDPKGGGFGNYLGTMKTAGLISYAGGGMVVATDALG